MVEDAHELAEIDIRDASITPDDQHVFVVIALRCAAEVSRPGDYGRIFTQGIDEHELVMNVEILVQSCEFLLKKIR